MKTTTISNSASGKKAADPIRIVEMATYQEPLIVSAYGDPGAGKSRLIGTAPDPIGVLPMEHKSRQSIMKVANEFGKKVYAPEIDLIRTDNPMLIASLPPNCVAQKAPSNATPGWIAAETQKISKAIPLDGEPPICCQIHYYRHKINRAKSVAFRLAAMDEVRTIGIDTFGQMVEDMLFANYGRVDAIMPLDRKSFNQEVRDFINAISHKNLILTHHSSNIWKDQKPTNKTKPMSSFGKIGHFTSVMIEQTRDDDADVEAGEPRYTLTVKDCQANAELIGLDVLMDENITFKNLAMLVYPDSDEEVWD